jgi:UMP-CMP kinase
LLNKTSKVFSHFKQYSGLLEQESFSGTVFYQRFSRGKVLLSKSKQDQLGMANLNQLPTVIFVLGGPGAGKGTQCNNIVKYFGFTHLSAGDLLRAEMNSGSKHGDMISSMIREGKIVPSEVTVGLLEKAVEQSKNKLFLIDGFPRNEENNESWKKEMASKVNLAFVLVFECPEEVLQKRLVQRGENSGRSDDNLESIRKRFRTYVESTMPIIADYEKQDKLLKIDGNRPIDSVWNDVLQCFLNRGFHLVNTDV